MAFLLRLGRNLTHFIERGPTLDRIVFCRIPSPSLKLSMHPMAFTDFELLIVGAGPVGCVIAERAASQLGWRSVIVEKRAHIAGNCYDRTHESGVRVQEYGPHYFRSNSKNLIDYLSKFTEWIPGDYRVKSQVKGKLYPFPLNLESLSMFFGRELDAASAEKLLSTVAIKISTTAKNSEEYVLSKIGRELYEAFYLGYSTKQWGRTPAELEASVCGRIPIRLNRDDRYVDHLFQQMPKDGFTRLFQRMLQSPLIEVRLGVDYRQVKSVLKPLKATVYCGPIDEYFDCRLGKLPWRSLDFEFKSYPKEWQQDCVQINYPNEHAYTRSVEFKHVTKQSLPSTVVAYEYPKSDGDPYYPVPALENRNLYAKYLELADQEQKTKIVFFSGRLARYTYINTDEAIEMAFATFEELRKL